MAQACAAGLTPREIEQLTLGEVFIAIEGYAMREKDSLIGRVNAICRGLSTLSKDAKPFEGLVDSAKKKVSLAGANTLWFWRPKE